MPAHLGVDQGSTALLADSVQRQHTLWPAALRQRGCPFAFLPQGLDLSTAEAHHIAPFPFATSAPKNADALNYFSYTLGQMRHNPQLLALVSAWAFIVAVVGRLQTRHLSCHLGP